MIEIRKKKIKSGSVYVPGSKSYTHRMLIASSLSDGICSVSNPLVSEDTFLTKHALRKMGVKIEDGENSCIVHGTKGLLGACAEHIDLVNSGTSMRLLTSVAALGKGEYIFTGSDRMQKRPITDLLDALHQIGIDAQSICNTGCPPVKIKGGNISGGTVSINCNMSSQFLSSVLLIAPYTIEGLDITVAKGPVSKPYVDMTIDIINQFGVSVDRTGYSRFKIKGCQTYQSGNYTVEPDCSQASYFWAAAAITGNTIKVKGISTDSAQGDVKFVNILEQMGCKVSSEKDGIAVSGGALSAVEVDMADMPDVVPTLAVVAAFAKGVTIIKNVAHLKEKESNRLEAVSSELSKMGINAHTDDNNLFITGGMPKGAPIDTYNDHRIAMSFAVAGLMAEHTFIKEQTCVEKSFPTFWDVFNGLYEK
jgi:3-phosphoshikimate 1-carboxyvinyltransferase